MARDGQRGAHAAGRGLVGALSLFLQQICSSGSPFRLKLFAFLSSGPANNSGVNSEGSAGNSGVNSGSFSGLAAVCGPHYAPLAAWEFFYHTIRILSRK
jgi:hypothetical protein